MPTLTHTHTHTHGHQQAAHQHTSTATSTPAHQLGSLTHSLTDTTELTDCSLTDR